MDRSKLSLIPIYCLVGFMSVLLAAPASRWVILRQIDVLAGRWRSGSINFSGMAQPGVAPVERGLINDDLDPNPTAKFLYLIGVNYRAETVADSEQRARDLYEICASRNDVRYWAQLIKALSIRATIPYKETDPLWGDPKNDPTRRDLLDRACTTASNLDPSNAYFPLIQAGVTFRSGDLARAEKLILEASDRPDFQDYAWFDPELRLKYLDERNGYRGEQVRALIIAETILPQLAVILSIGRHYSQSPDPKIRYAVARLGDLLMRRSETISGVYVGSEIMTFALDPKHRIDRHIDLTLPEARRLAIALQRESGSGVTLHPSIDLSSKVTQQVDNLEPTSEVSRNLYSLQPAFSAAALLLLLVAPLVCAAVSFKTAKASFGYAAPHLAWLVALSTEPAFFPSGGPGTHATVFGLAALLFIPACFDKTKRYADILGVLAGLTALAVGASDPYVLPAAGLFLTSLVIGRMVKSVPVWLTTLFVLLACAVTVAYWMPMVVVLNAATGFVFGGLVLIGSSSAVPVTTPFRWRPVVGATVAILGVGYTVMAYRDLTADKQMAAVGNTLLHDGDRLRSAVSE